jgi:radical SAM protein with 4Fe4S-binding SPASM domain
MELIQYASRIGLNVSIISNGSFITKPEIAKQLSKYCRVVTISLDSLEEDEHDFNRGRGSWKKAKKAIDLLIEAKANLKINQTITNKNIGAIKPLRYFTRENEITHNIGPFSEIGRGQTNEFSLSKSERFDIEAESLNNKLEHNEIPLQPFKIKQHCGFGLEEFSIDSFGNVFLCKVMHDETLKAGNLKNTSIEDIITKSNLFKLAKNSHVDKLAKCKKCSFKYLCSGGCRGIHYSNTGKVDGTMKSECENSKKLIKECMWSFFRKEDVHNENINV